MKQIFRSFETIIMMKHYDIGDEKEANIYVAGNMLYEAMKHVNFQWKQKT